LPLMNVDGEEDVILPLLYQVFVADFKIGKPAIYGYSVCWNTWPSPGRPYEEGFIHIVTEDGPPRMRRTFEPKRAARIRWCAPAILNCDCPTITAWQYKEGSGRIRTYLWRQDVEYLVILEKQTKSWGTVYFLVTAYHADGRSTQAKLQKKYQNRIR
jgi:hypothetical protein